MRPGTHVVAAIAVLALAGCENHPFHDPAPATGPLLTGEILKTTLAGNSVATDPDAVPPLVVYFSGNGEMRGMHSNNYRDVGTWRVENDTVCGNWQNWWGTLNRCWEVYRFEDRLTLVRVDDGREATAFLVPGNPKNL